MNQCSECTINSGQSCGNVMIATDLRTWLNKMKLMWESPLKPKSEANSNEAEVIKNSQKWL